MTNNLNELPISRFIDVSTAVDMLGLSEGYVRHLLTKGDIRSARVGRAILVLKEDVISRDILRNPVGTVTPGEAAKRVGVTKATIYSWIKSGYLPATQAKAGGVFRFFIDESELADKYRHRPFEKLEVQDSQPQQLTLF